MNGKLLILFVILVLGLILASFLGGSVIENMENAKDASQNTTSGVTVKDIPEDAKLPFDTKTPAITDASATTAATTTTPTTTTSTTTASTTAPTAASTTKEPVIATTSTTPVNTKPSSPSVTDVALSETMSYPSISIPNMAAQNMPNTSSISSQCSTTAASTPAPVAPSLPPAPVGPSIFQNTSSQGSFNPFGFHIVTPPIPITIPSFTISPLNPMSSQGAQSPGIQFGSQQQPIVENNNIRCTSDFDNYNHFYKTSYPDQFYGTNGGTARIIDTGSNNMLVITNQNGSTDIYYLTGEKQSSNAYYGPNGSTAKVVSDGGVVTGIKVAKPDGALVYYYKDQSKITKSVDDTLNQASNAGLTDTASGSYKGSGVKEAFCLPLEDDRSKWMAALPKGVPKSQILPGEENLYILKSEVIPPVCPKCPEPIVNCPGETKFENMKCPPCPPCARCPEPAFDCKKVPNYSAVNNLQSGGRSMPVPVVSDFSAFGM